MLEISLHLRGTAELEHEIANGMGRGFGLPYELGDAEGCKGRP